MALTEKQLLRAAEEALGELLAAPIQARRPNGSTPEAADLVVQGAGFTFVVEAKARGAAGPVAAAAERARRAATTLTAGGADASIPLVVVPYMGEAGREQCVEQGVSWLDLSGNARVVAPGLRIVVEGRPNQFKRRGRPATAFAPKSSRIARCLLMHEGEWMTQRQIARTTDVDEGYTSRVVAKLDEDGLIVRNEDGAIRARDPSLLLDAWNEQYDFGKHHVLRGHVAARSGASLLSRLSEAFREHGFEHAATGLGAAWLFTHFAGFRLATFYLSEVPTDALKRDLSFREDPRGANVWLVVPNDEGVFHGARVQEGVSCVHPVQAYLDLHAHPERADEAASELRARLLTWSRDD